MSLKLLYERVLREDDVAHAYADRLSRAGMSGDREALMAGQGLVQFIKWAEKKTPEDKMDVLEQVLDELVDFVEKMEDGGGDENGEEELDSDGDTEIAIPSV